MTLKSLTATVLSGVALTVFAQTASAGTIAEAMREDGFDRAVAAQQALWMAEDGFDDAVAAKAAWQSAPRLAPDTAELIARSELRQAIVPRQSDSVDGALNAPSSSPVVSTPTSSGREIEWPQMGIGFGLGLVLAVGFYLALRFTRTRALAH